MSYEYNLEHCKFPHFVSLREFNELFITDLNS